MKTRLAACGLICLFAACSTPYHSGTKPQEQYAPKSLFMSTHGKFMLDKDTWRPDVQGSLLTMSDAEVKAETGDFNLHYGKLDVESMIFLPDPDSFLKVGAQYSARRYEFSTGALGAHDEDLHRGSVSLGYGYFLGGKESDTLVEFNFNPGVWTDASGTFHHDDWQFYGGALLTYRYMPEIYIKVGAEHSGLFRDAEVYPMVGVTWLASDSTRFDVLAPRYARVTHDLDESTSLILSLDLDGGEYHVRAPVGLVNSKIPRTINVQELNLSIGASHRFDSQLSAFVKVGTTLLGDYVWRSNSAVDVYDGTVEPQLFFDIGFGWSF